MKVQIYHIMYIYIYIYRFFLQNESIMCHLLSNSYMILKRERLKYITNLVISEFLK